MKIVNTWQRNPQDSSDEHDWSGWFADPRDYRDTVWNIHADGLIFSATPRKVRAHG